MNYQKSRMTNSIPKSSTENWILREISAINRVLISHSTGAMTHPNGSGALVARSSHVSYRIEMGSGKKLGVVESLHNELNEAVSRSRGKATKIRFGYMPFAIEVPHPQNRPLQWESADTQVNPHSMLVGRSYSHMTDPKSEIANFDDTPHILIVGETGAGKSVLQAAMLLSLCANTSPNELKIVLIDLKNEDLVPFARLPHVLGFAGKPEDAMKAIEYVYGEMVNRIDNPESSTCRIVLAIDELARLADNKEARQLLGEIGGVGRSKSINLIGATQHPTKDGGLGSMMKASFPLRLVGMVTPGLSHIATGRPKAGADLLPGKGSFLWCKGQEVRRFQSYNITPVQVGLTIDKICVKWGTGDSWRSDWRSSTSSLATNQLSPAIASQTDPKQGGNTIASDDRQSINFPIGEGRPLTQQEQAEVKCMADNGKFNYRGNVSINQAMIQVYGSRGTDRAEWIKEAIGV